MRRVCCLGLLLSARAGSDCLGGGCPSSEVDAAALRFLGRRQAKKAHAGAPVDKALLRKGRAGALQAIEDVVLQGDKGTPGFIIERTFHSAPVYCPWLAKGEAPDAACAARTAHITGMWDKIAQCERPLAFNLKTIGHRGAALVAPEESLRGYQVAALSGAGWLECDASVTKDLDLVCRHSVCDLHFTTDLVAHHPDLNRKCSVPFVPGSAKEAKCCTFDFTMAELLRLCAVMESATNSSATSAEEYLIGAPGFRSNVGGSSTCHQLVSYEQYLRLLKRSGYNAIPELKDTALRETEAFLESRGKGFAWLADKFAQTLWEKGFRPWRFQEQGTGFAVLQTFDYRVAFHWKRNFPELAVEYMWETAPEGDAWCVDGHPHGPGADCGGHALIEQLHHAGVDMFSPPIFILLAAGPGRTVVQSATAEFLKSLGVKSIGSWSLERQGTSSRRDPPYEQPPTLLREPSVLAPSSNSSWYYSSTDGISTWQHSDVLPIMDALFTKVGIKSLFSDFPATVSAFVNCVLAEH